MVWPGNHGIYRRWWGVDKTQEEWANILNTTETGGTWIGSIVNAINSYTNWDSSEHGGQYIIYYLNGRTQAWFENAHRLRIGLGMAPIVENVNLIKNSSRMLRAKIPITLISNWVEAIMITIASTGGIQITFSILNLGLE